MAEILSPEDLFGEIEECEECGAENFGPACESCGHENGMDDDYLIDDDSGRMASLGY